MNFTDDCKNVVERMIQAYRVKTAKELSNKLDIGLSVISNRIMRNSFPADFIVKCSLETGANLMWLCTGKGDPGIDKAVKTYIDLINVPRQSLVNGKLVLFPSADLDRTMLPDEINQPEVIKAGKTHYIIDKKFEITNGKYVIDIEGSIGIYDLYRVPVGKAVISGGDLPEKLELNVNDIKVIAKVAVVMSEV